MEMTAAGMAEAKVRPTLQAQIGVGRREDHRQHTAEHHGPDGQFKPAARSRRGVVRGRRGLIGHGIPPKEGLT
jgi:hypothetical protein